MTRGLTQVLIIIVAGLGLVACGGGSGGGGGDGPQGAALLEMNGVPGMGATDGITTVVPFNVSSPSPSSLVGPNNFPVTGGISFIEMQFNTPVLASSLIDGTFSGNDGLEIRDSNGAVVRYFLDVLGTIDPTNVFLDFGVAPSLVRLYIHNAANPETPVALPAGQYTLNIITTRLLGASGQPFCLQSSGGTCVNDVEVVYSFSVGGDTTPLAAASVATIPLVNATVQVNQEYRFFFNDHVDFQSLVGLDPMTGMPNVTQQDPYMSRVFPVNNVIAGATSSMENLRVLYTAPAPTALPPNYGFVVYMPDPFHNSTEVRLRTVDMTQLFSADGGGNVQNYGIEAAVWESANLSAPTNAGGQTLSLPPILPLPGSNPGGTASIAITLFSGTNALASDASSNMDGMIGITDRSRNPLSADLGFGFNYDVGPEIANNVSPPDLNLVASGTRLSAVSSATSTVNATPGGTLLGGLTALASPLDDPMMLGQIGDVEFGAFLSPANGIGNPPRRTNNAAVIQSGGDPGIPFPQGGTPQTGLAGTPPTPPLGVRLYVTDTTANEVRIFDSTTFLSLGRLVGIPSPRGLGRDPSGQFLYISNFDQATVMRVGINPAQTNLFHQVASTATVGFNPTAVSVQPGNEDVFVLNSGENTMSKIDVATGNTVGSFATGQGSLDLFATQRMVPGTLAYQVYVTNLFDDTVSVFESESVLQQVPNGMEGSMIAAVTGFSGPSYGAWNQFSFSTGQLGSVGALIANSTGGTVDHLAMVNFGLAPPVGFPGPPAFRTFQNVQNLSTPIVGFSG